MRIFGLMMLPLLLASCHLFEGHKPKHAMRKPKPVVTVSAPAVKPEAYVENLSLAALAEEMDTEPTANLDVIQAYTARPVAKKKIKSEQQDNPVRVQATIVECRSKRNGTSRKLVAPSGVESQSALMGVVARMTADGCALTNVTPVVVDVTRGEPFNAESEDASTLARQRFDALVADSVRLDALDEAAQQVQLARIFLEKRERDGAYLAVENAKQSLAAAERTPAHQKMVKELLKELETTERQVKETLPFTL